MANSYMQIIFIDSDDQARHTNLRAAKNTDAQTWAAFNSYRRYAVDIKQACFLLDYYNRKGDMADTIALDAFGFTAITGQMPKTDAAYREIDDGYWAEAREASTSEQQTVACQ